jgi:hypothetical protein
MAMSEYRIESTGSAFVVIDDAGEKVHTYPTQAAAVQDIERCRVSSLCFEPLQAVREPRESPVLQHRRFVLGR